MNRTFHKTLKISMIILITMFHLCLLAGINYILPSYKIVHVTGVEVKRADNRAVISQLNSAEHTVRDVYYIYTQEPQTQKVKVYRNEDTGWGMPFYFKFNAADIQAKAQTYALDKKYVQLKYYGWRIPWLNEFQNVVSIKVVQPSDLVAKPLLSYFFYAVLLLSLFLAIQLIRGWFDSAK